jgi:voltage-gated potassium channel
MPLLLLSSLRAIWALRREPQFSSLALLAATAIISGTGFYSLVEGLRFVDALYFSVVTLTTVGYGDFAPETDAGKLFTTVYVLVGVGILLAFVTTVAAKVSQMPLLHPPRSEPTQDDYAVASRAAGSGASITPSSQLSIAVATSSQPSPTMNRRGRPSKSSYSLLAGERSYTLYYRLRILTPS